MIPTASMRLISGIVHCLINKMKRCNTIIYVSKTWLVTTTIVTSGFLIAEFASDVAVLLELAPKETSVLLLISITINCKFCASSLSNRKTAMMSNC